jgi:protein-S-isoprenylcysteine O-methyltransferase Ste14
MIDKLSLIMTCMVLLLIMIVVLRGIITNQKIFGEPPIPIVFFLLAKFLVVVNLVFLMMHGLQIKVWQIVEPPVIIEVIALVSLFAGLVLLILSTIKLNKDLIFGLSGSEGHHLQTHGIYAISRHPFYLGFIFILFSSCLFTPNIINIIAFIGAWSIHHVIMIREEKSLEAIYGPEYLEYKHKVSRYLNLKLWP